MRMRKIIGWGCFDNLSLSLSLPPYLPLMFTKVPTVEVESMSLTSVCEHNLTSFGVSPFQRITTYLKNCQLSRLTPDHYFMSCYDYVSECGVTDGM